MKMSEFYSTPSQTSNKQHLSGLPKPSNMCVVCEGKINQSNPGEKKYGILSCKNCSEFVQNIQNILRIRKELLFTSGIDCQSSTVVGQCSLPPMVQIGSQKVNNKANTRCRACWLKRCIESYKLDEEEKRVMYGLLPRSMRPDAIKFDYPDVGRKRSIPQAMKEDTNSIFEENPFDSELSMSYNGTIGGDDDSSVDIFDDKSQISLFEQSENDADQPSDVPLNTEKKRRGRQPGSKNLKSSGNAVTKRSSRKAPKISNGLSAGNHKGASRSPDPWLAETKSRLSGGIGFLPTKGSSSHFDIVCAICERLRSYKFFKQAKKFGVFTCETCRKFISTIVANCPKRYPYTARVQFNCNMENELGNCDINNVQPSFRGHKRCKACLLAKCIERFKMPYKQKAILSNILQDEMQLLVLKRLPAIERVDAITHIAKEMQEYRKPPKKQIALIAMDNPWAREIVLKNQEIIGAEQFIP